MIKYITVASALKMFSLTPQTRWAYRQLGNTVGQRMTMRKGLEEWRMMNAREILELIARLKLFKDGDRILELGTGWVHWEGTVIRLFYDVEITLFDVWDNRQFLAYKRFFHIFEEIMDHELSLTMIQSKHAHRLLQVIADSNSFEEVYKAFGFTYVINSEGSLTQFPDNYFSCIHSCNVFEHIKRETVPGLIKDFARILKPGGYSIQGVDMGDHIAYYDTTVFRKNYICVSNAIWKQFCENEVQYFNRIQRTEWLDYFHKNGFKLVEEHANPIDISKIKIDKDFANLARTDLECLNMVIVHQKPY